MSLKAHVQHVDDNTWTVWIGNRRLITLPSKGGADDLAAAINETMGAERDALAGEVERLKWCYADAMEKWSQDVQEFGTRAREAEAKVAQLTEERDAALREMTAYARQAGEAIGKLETSEAAGIVEGWKERTTAAEAKVETLTRERDEASAQLASVHEEYALCRKLLMERVEDLDAAHDRAEALEKGLESLINAAPTLIVKAVRAPPDAEGLEDWSAAIGNARALLQPTERGDG